MKTIRKFLLYFLLLFPLRTVAQLPTDAPKTKAQLSALEHKVKNGDAHARYVLACCYMNGVSGVVPVKLSKGKSLLKKAADAGDADACRMMYKLDPQTNILYHEKAYDAYRKQATGQACFYIADLYATDRKQCMRWLKTSMMKGYAKAKVNLESMFQNESDKSMGFDAWCDAIEAYEIGGAKPVPTPVLPSMELADEEETDDIDTNIPQTKRKNKRMIALIIGNEKYQANDVGNVPYAERDAAVFAQYCHKTLGLPAEHVRSCLNQTAAQMRRQVRLLQQTVKEGFKGDVSVIFYYSGHGVPNGEGTDTYLLPIDADGLDMESCYSLKRLYSELEQMNAKNVIVLTDACFSGKGRGLDFIGGDRGQRGVAMKAKSADPKGNMVVFSAASGDETAWPYKKKGHGLFTYFLLKKLQESQGDCTLGELSSYIEDNVKLKSLMENQKQQTPRTEPSQGLQGVWRNMKIKFE